MQGDTKGEVSMVTGRGTVTLELSRKEALILHELLNYYVDLDNQEDQYFIDDEEKTEAQTVLEDILFALKP